MVHIVVCNYLIMGNQIVLLDNNVASRFPHTVRLNIVKLFLIKIVSEFGFVYTVAQYLPLHFIWISSHNDFAQSPHRTK